MASAAEQLAANVNWSAFSKAEELQKRIWFTLGALVVYRLGTFIPIPGIDPIQLPRIMEQQTQGISGDVQPAVGRCGRAHGDLRLERDALYLSLDHHAGHDDRQPRA